MKRDVQLDAYRAMLMIYIVCFIHVEFWLEYGKEPMMSLSLVEMPLIFFVSGAALSYRREPRPFWTTVCNRGKRILLPYYIYALIMLCIVVFWHGIDILTWKDCVKVLLCNNIPHLPYASHLWFIVPYMVLSCTFDVQKRILTRMNRGGYLCLCAILFLVVSNITENLLIRNVLCYNVFMVAGYVYYRNARLKYVCFLGLTAFVLLVAFRFYHISFCPMQGHKFPPDVVFFAYNLLVFAALSILFSKITLPNWRILRFWNEHGFSIYLFQNIPYTVVALAIRHGMFTSSPWVQMFLSIASIFVISTVMFMVWNRLKKSLGVNVG